MVSKRGVYILFGVHGYEFCSQRPSWTAVACTSATPMWDDRRAHEPTYGVHCGRFAQRNLDYGQDRPPPVKTNHPKNNLLKCFSRPPHLILSAGSDIDVRKCSSNFNFALRGRTSTLHSELKLGSRTLKFTFEVELRSRTPKSNLNI